MFTYGTTKKKPQRNSTQKKLFKLKVLPNLCKDPSIITNKADKSNSIFIMDRTDYDNKIQSHLKYKNTYAMIIHDHTDQFADKIKTELKTPKQSGRITPQLCNQCFPWGSFCPKFIAFIPLLYSQRSYKTKLVDLVEKLENTKISADTIITSFEIVSLYTNIDLRKSEI